MLSGISASHGIGIGSIRVIKEHDLHYEAVTIEDIGAEKKRFEDAVDKFKKETAEMAEDIRKRIGPKEAEILESHLIMIDDPTMSGEMRNLIDAGQCSESAVEAVCDSFISLFSELSDEFMQQRATDVSDIKLSLLKLLLGVEDTDIRKVPPGTILVAKDLTPSMTSQIRKENVLGIITEVGGKTSHSAIIARALEIPAVLSVPRITEVVKNKDTAIVDGSLGTVYINPEGDILSQYSIQREEYLKKQTELKDFFGKETKTADGLEPQLFCNIGSPKDAKKVIECDGEGVGLFRSEFLFMDNAVMPTEEEQFNAYKEAAQIMDGKTLIIRTLDIGGDKDIPYLHMKKEENPFLGYRAVRYCLGNQEVFRTQLCAILRASAFGKVKIMLPLVSCVEELRAAKELISEIKVDLEQNGMSYDRNIEVGCMIETPSASLIADILAKESDFFSIGTNDLTQYTMTVDRGNADVSYLYSTFHPSVLRSVKHIIDSGKAAGIPVGMCGEAASDPLFIPLLLSFGLNEFSVNPALVLATRCVISKWTKTEADALSEKVMSLSTEAEIVAVLKEAVKE